MFDVVSTGVTVGKRYRTVQTDFENHFESLISREIAPTLSASPIWVLYFVRIIPVLIISQRAVTQMLSISFQKCAVFLRSKKRVWSLILNSHLHKGVVNSEISD